MKNNLIHPKLLDFNTKMLFSFPYYAEIFLKTNITRNDACPTMGVNVTSKGFRLVYNEEFVNGLSEGDLSFIGVHEILHLLYDHPARTTKQYNHMLANIAQDMIINNTIRDEIMNRKEFATVPKGALFIPSDYTGPKVFEKLYEWLEQKQDDRGEGQGQGEGEGNSDGEPQEGQGQGNGESNGGQSESSSSGQGNGKQGNQQSKKQPNGDGQSDQKKDGDEKGEGKGKGKNKKDAPKEKGNGESKTYDEMMDEMEKNINETDGQTLDQHISDEVPREIRQQMVKDILSELKNRGLMPGEFEAVLNSIRKSKKDYLKQLKRGIAQLKGGHKSPSWNYENRSGVWGMKGNIRQNHKITVVHDTSGSMGGYHEKIMSYLLHGQEIVYIQQDANDKPNFVQNIKTKSQLKKIKITGCGGTRLQPAIEFAKKNYPKYPMAILTDGYTDTLDFAGFNGQVLIISCGEKAPLVRNEQKVKQIIIPKED